jgi:hypothetical protein
MFSARAMSPVAITVAVSHYPLSLATFGFLFSLLSEEKLYTLLCGVLNNSRTILRELARTLPT